MHQSIYRSVLDRLSTDMRPTCRSIVNRESTDVLVEIPRMSADVSTVTISVGYRLATGEISVNKRPICRPILSYRSTYRPIFRRYLTADIGQPSIGRHIGRQIERDLADLCCRYSSSDRSTLNRVMRDVLRNI